MNKSKIEWCDYTWNPITGCSRRCPYCYAQAMAMRLKGRFGYPKDDPFRVTFHPNRLKEPLEVEKPSKIFTCSMGEFHDRRVRYLWQKKVFDIIILCPQHIFQILTKQHQEIKNFKYPSNVWIGITVDGLGLDSNIAITNLRVSAHDNVKFISFEPFLNRLEPNLEGIDWVIIGALTGRRKATPDKEWVETLTKIAQDAGCAVFHKDNLGYGWLKEFPRGIKPTREKGRSRTKKGRWRKKRSDAGIPRMKKVD